MRIITLLILFLLVSVPAHADMVWPALILVTRFFSVWPIVVGLIVEYPFLRQYFNLPIKRALIVDVVINATSFVLGIILIPIAGIVWEFFPGTIMYSIFNVGTFNPVTWTATYLIAVVINAIIESFALSKFFKCTINIKGFFVLFLANAISVGIAIVSLYFYPENM